MRDVASVVSINDCFVAVLSIDGALYCGSRKLALVVSIDEAETDCCPSNDVNTCSSEIPRSEEATESRVAIHHRPQRRSPPGYRGRYGCFHTDKSCTLKCVGASLEIDSICPATGSIGLAFLGTGTAVRQQAWTQTERLLDIVSLTDDTSALAPPWF